jgi:hypothetical protein
MNHPGGQDGAALSAPTALAQGLYYSRGDRPVLRLLRWAAATDFAGLPDRCAGRSGVARRLGLCLGARSRPALS